MAADRLQMAQSPAYAALSPSGRRVLALIDSKVTHGGGVAAISFSDIEQQCGMIHGTCGFALRQVKLLGFQRRTWTGSAPSHQHFPVQQCLA